MVTVSCVPRTVPTQPNTKSVAGQMLIRTPSQHKAKQSKGAIEFEVGEGDSLTSIGWGRLNAGDYRKEKVGYVTFCWENVPGRGNSQHKGPETLHAWSVEPNKEVSVAEMTKAEGRTQVKEVPEMQPMMDHCRVAKFGGCCV